MAAGMGERKHRDRTEAVPNPNISEARARVADVELTRLRLGHCGLASRLALVGKETDGKCERCRVPEKVSRAIMCPAYIKQRR